MLYCSVQMITWALHAILKYDRPCQVQQPVMAWDPDLQLL